MKTVSLKNQMLWNSAGNLIYMACQWLVTVLVANLGTFEEAGILSLAMSVSATFQTLALFGIRSYQVSDLEKKHSDTSYVFLRGVTCVVALLSCMVFSVINGYGKSTLLSIFLFMLFRLAEDYSDVLHGIAQKNDRLDVAGKSFAIKGIGLLVCFLAGYRLTGSLNAGLASMAALSCLSTLFYDWFLVRRIAPFSAVGLWKDAFRLGKNTLLLCVYSFLFSAMSTVPKLILEKISGEEILGIYSSIFAPALLISAMAGYLYNPMIPKFATLKNEENGKQMRALFLKICVLLLGVGLIVTAAGYLLGSFGLKLLLGEKILPYTDLLVPILIGIFAISLLSFFCMVEVVFRDFAGLLIGCALGIVAELLLIPQMISTFGMNGTSYGMIMAVAVSSAVLLVRIFVLMNPLMKERG